MLFNILSDLLFFKRGDQLQSVESETEVQPYMLNRWISMHSPTSALLINLTNNKYWSVLQNKLDWYHFTLAVIPKNKFTKVEYIKKATKEKKPTAEANDDKILEILARNLEISVREVKSYIEDYNIDISHLRKVFKNDK
jgi:hypothetical protein